ncbi:diguanylate cyclase [bacterium]|nr:diguanylate cyclase [bacterium]
MKNIVKVVYIVLFVVVSSLVLYVSYMYKKDLVDIKRVEYFNNESIKVNNEIKKLIKARQENQLLIIQQLVQDKKVIQVLKTKAYDLNSMQYVANRLDTAVGLKDAWFQFIDNKGICIARSWRNDRGDNLSLIRNDVLSMINRPRVINSISVGWFDMTFKTMVPIFDESHKFLGAMELISNFDALSDTLDTLGYKAVFLVDKRYKKQLKDPRTKRFIGDSYVANKDADKSLLDYIQNNGIDHFISPYHSYVIDDGSVVFNYALFDKKELLIANLFVFKKLSSFDLQDIDNTKIKMNISTAIVILLIVIGFYVLSLSHIPIVKIDRTFYKLLLLFAVVYFLYFILVTLYYKEQKNEYIRTYNDHIRVEYDNVTNRYANMADLIYKTDLQTPEVIDILKSVEISSKKDRAREKLYDLLKYDYELFKPFGVRQIQFHLKNNESFLRFDNLAAYGDDLSEIRQTVKWVNKYHEKVEGFEEGRLNSGFRYIYPIFDEYDSSNILYLGSVEVSFSSFYFIRDLSRLYQFKSTLLINTDVINKKVYSSQRSNYTDSIYKGWSFDKRVTEKLKNLSVDADISLIDPKSYQFIEKSVIKGEIFSIEVEDGNYFFTFVPLVNPIDKKVVAVIVLQKDEAIYVTLHNNIAIALLVGFILLLFVFLYMYKELSIKKEYKLLLRKMQRILDTQDSIIIITNDEEMVDANKKFLDFFGFGSLDEFKLHYRCITEKFLEDNRLLNIDRFQKTKEWIYELEKMNSKDKVVSMMDKNGEVHFFSIKDSKIDENYLLEFSDISDTMKDKFQFINKAYKDNLTKAFNREYFDSNIEDILSNKNNAGSLGIIFCDIDYFKSVNDTYGHDAGDYILKRIVELIHKNIRAEDIVIRWGGEEFIILLYVDSMDILVRIANNVRAAIEEESFDYAGTVTCSFGISQYVKGENILSAIKRADEALYEAKQAGRNRVKIKF